MCICLVVQCRDRNSLVCVYLCLNHPSLTFPCCLCVILLRTYLLRTDINSVSALILFLCYDTKFHSSALSYINKPHANSHTLVHTDTMIDGYERITWYKIICYFETIDLCVTQWNKSLSEASLQQSISACSPIHRILIMWSIYFLRCWIHRNMASLSRDKYNHIKKPNKYDKNSIVGWQCFMCEAPRMEVLKAQSSPEYHPSSEQLQKGWIYYVIFGSVFLRCEVIHYIPSLSCNKQVQLTCKAAS